MGEYILFSDAMWVAMQGLIDGFAGLGVTVDVTSWVPRDTATRIVPPLVTVLRTGGERRNLIADDAQVAIECWGATDAAAHDLCAQARGLLHALAGTVVDGVAVYRVDEVAGPALLPDPDAGVPRYTATFSLTLRHTASSS